MSGMFSNCPSLKEINTIDEKIKKKFKDDNSCCIITAFLLLERPPKIKKKGGGRSNFSKAKFLCLSSLNILLFSPNILSINNILLLIEKNKKNIY